MDITKKYVVNKSYMLGNDERRSYITYRYHPKLAPIGNDGAVSNFFAFLDPEIVKILTFFDGTASLPKIIEKISERLKISKDYLEKMIPYIIQNNKKICITYKGKRFILPPNVIVPLKENESPYIYTQEDFDCTTTDFSQTRLFKFPLDITFMVNTICAVDCIYCYADCRKKMDCKIPQNKIKNLIEQCRKNGVRLFDLMGGEVFLYKNWKWLVTTMFQNGYVPYISTKIPITKETIFDVYDSGIRLFQISLDSFEPDILEKNLNISDGITYVKKMRQTLRDAEKSDLKVNIHSVITKYNKDISHLSLLIEELSQYNNIAHLQLSIAGPSLYKPGFLNHRLSEEDVKKIKIFVSENKEKFLFNLNLSSDQHKSVFLNDFDNKANVFGNRALCTGNVRQVYILPNGDVTFCEQLMFNPKFILGNIINEDLQTIWKRNSCSYMEDIESYNDSICGKCSSFDSCRKGISSSGVCWKEILYAYGEEKWNYPDPKCPYAPQEMNVFYTE